MATHTLFPLVSADVAVFSVANDALNVLVVHRARDPEPDRWALPGAVLKPDRDDDLEQTARRALAEKIGVEVPFLEQVRTFSGRHRDPRGWSISVLYCALLRPEQVHAVAKSKVKDVRWHEVEKAPALAFDHGALLTLAVQSLRDKVERHALPLHLMPERFTLTALQRTCEAVLGRKLDKSAFRRRLKSTTDLSEQAGEFELGHQRPAQLYRARDGFIF